MLDKSQEHEKNYIKSELLKFIYLNIASIDNVTQNIPDSSCNTSDQELLNVLDILSIYSESNQVYFSENNLEC